jgi:hypothetical protein
VIFITLRTCFGTPVVRDCAVVSRLLPKNVTTHLTNVGKIQGKLAGFYVVSLFFLPEVLNYMNCRRILLLITGND